MALSRHLRLLQDFRNVVEVRKTMDSGDHECLRCEGATLRIGGERSDHVFDFKNKIVSQTIFAFFIPVSSSETFLKCFFVDEEFHATQPFRQTDAFLVAESHGRLKNLFCGGCMAWKLARGRESSSWHSARPTRLKPIKHRHSNGDAVLYLVVDEAAFVVHDGVAKFDAAVHGAGVHEVEAALADLF